MGRPEGDLPGQALEVEDALERFPQLAPGDGRAEGLGDGVLPRGDRRGIPERAAGARPGGAGRRGRSR